jgi:hypothetical protein
MKLIKLIAILSLVAVSFSSDVLAQQKRSQRIRLDLPMPLRENQFPKFWCCRAIRQQREFS